MRANVKFSQLRQVPQLPRPVSLPKIDTVFVAGWWVILTLTIAFWYWIGSVLGIVG